MGRVLIKFVSMLIATLLCISNVEMIVCANPLPSYSEGETTINSDGYDNILPLNNGLIKSVYGVTYTCENGEYTISGTPNKSSYLNILGSNTSIPTELHEGDAWHVSFNSRTNYITFGIRAFNDENPDGVWLLKTKTDVDYTIPDLSQYSGVAVRITTTQSTQNFNVSVTPSVVVEKNYDSEGSQEEQEEEKKEDTVDGNEVNILRSDLSINKEVGGITYSYENGVLNIKGTAEKSSCIDIMGAKTIMPDAIKTGDRWHVSFQSGTAYVSIGMRAFNDQNPDGVWLFQTSSETEFTVPDLTGYTGVAIRILVSQSDASYDMELEPCICIENITFNTPMITIIDDDGDIHFKTDVVPLINRTNVPISTAVTTTRIGASSRWMNWDQISECYEAGAEILCHTYSHYSGTEIQSIDDNTIISNYQKAREELLSRGYSGGDILVYSSSTGNIERVQKDAAEVFKCGIKIGGNSVNGQYTNKYALSRFRIDYASTEGKNDWDYSDMLAYIDNVSENGGWEIWMFHTSNSIYRQRVCLDANGEILFDSEGNPIPMVDDNNNPVLDIDGTYPTVGSTVYIPMLENAINYAKLKGVQIVTAEEGYSKYFE